MAKDRDAARSARAVKARARARARRVAVVQRALWATLAVVVIALVGVVAVRSSGGGPSVGGSAAIGAPAPDIEMTDFDGTRFSLADYEGRPLVLNFWASWCPNCVAEMPDFEKVFQATDGEVAFLGVNQSDAREPAEDLAHRTGVTYRLAEDPNGRVFQAFGGAGMPTTVFIDDDGRLVDVVVGQLSAGQLSEYIRDSFGVAVDA
ncbi:MAG: TlpA family protein disulfide reductase [Actinomycetota bacterium]